MPEHVTPTGWPPPVWPPPPPALGQPLAVAVVEQRPPLTTMPIRAAFGALAVTVLSLAGSRLVLEALADQRLPIGIYLAVAVSLGYLPMLGYSIWAARRYGVGGWRASLGFAASPADAGWGPVVWLACIGAEIVVALLITVANVPLTSNTESLDELRGERGVLIALLLTAVVAAPLVEELVFRGVVLRGFASRLPIWLAVGLQGIAFGLAHVDPARGIGNIGLVIVLSSVGVVLGSAAVLLRRIGPTIIAHAILNAVVMVVVLTVG